MGWVRVSDDFYDHQKFAALTVLGDAVWIRGLAYANRNLTDGFITERAARGLVDTHGLGIYIGAGGRDAEPQDGIDELVIAGIWHEPGHDCPVCPDPPARSYVIHDYLAYQPSRAQVEAKRQETAERVRRHRAGNAVTSPVTSGGSNGVSTTPPNPKSQVPKTSSKTSIDPSSFVGGVGDRTDEVIHRARLFGFDPDRVRQELTKALGEFPDDDMVMAVGVGILGRAKSVPRDATAYIVGAIRQHPQEAEQLAYGGAA